MKLTNRQLDVLINKVFNEISQPIIDENKKKIENFKPSSKIQYFKDKKKYKELEKEIQILQKKQEILKDKYYRKEYLGYKFSYHPLDDNRFIEYLAEQKVDLNVWPTKGELEAEIILAGADGIKDLIQELKDKYAK